MDKKYVLTQWGSEAVAFSSFGNNEISDYVESLKSLMHKIANFSDCDVFVTYGTLLGAVREGKVISYDFDFDLAIVISDFSNKDDLIKRFKKIIKLVRNIEGVVNVATGSACHFAISFKVREICFTVDLFLAWFEDDLLNQSFSIDKRFGIKKSDIYPLSVVELNNVLLPAPNNKSLLLSSLYGPDWMTPNSDFNYKDYFDGLGGQWPAEFTVFGRLKYNMDYWDSYYQKNNFFIGPSQFAIFASSFINNGSEVMELGSGNGRDTLYFSRLGYKILGTDYSESALDLIKSKAEGLCIDGLSLLRLDYADYISLMDFSSNKEAFFDAVYARFIFHSVSESVEQNILEMASVIIKKGGILLAEFRVFGDGVFDKKNSWNESEITSDHYRRPIDVDIFKGVLYEFGFDVVYQVVGKGYAYHPNDDPTVCRIIAKRL